jgi:hypothetical protein
MGGSHVSFLGIYLVLAGRYMMRNMPVVIIIEISLIHREDVDNNIPHFLN